MSNLNLRSSKIIDKPQIIINLQNNDGRFSVIQDKDENMFFNPQMEDQNSIKQKTRIKSQRPRKQIYQDLANSNDCQEFNQISEMVDQSNEDESQGSLTDDLDNKEKQIEYLNYDTNKGYSYLVPKLASWFNYDSISDFEKQQFPEFFDQTKLSKTPEIYKIYRNFIIQLHQKDPKIYLTGTTCRRALSGDVMTILKIHQFLEVHGIINFISQNINLNITQNKSYNSIVKYKNIDYSQNQKKINNKLQKVFSIQRPICNQCKQICGLTCFKLKDSLQQMIICFDCKINMKKEQKTEFDNTLKKFEAINLLDQGYKIQNQSQQKQHQNILNFIQNYENNEINQEKQENLNRELNILSQNQLVKEVKIINAINNFQYFQFL